MPGLTSTPSNRGTSYLRLVPTSSLNGIDTYFERLGDGPRLLFFNGSGSSIDTSRPLLEMLAAHFDVAVQDSRGLGRTELPEQPWTMADCATDGVALVDHLGWDTCLVAGISFAGMVAQELAVTVPARVTRLALMCTSSGGVGGSSYPLHELESLPADTRIATGLALLDRRFTGDWLTTHPGDQALVANIAAQRMAPQSQDAQRGAAGQLDARRDHDVYDRLSLITSPTIVACGRFDGIAPVENSKAIAAQISGADLRIYEGGHLFFLQDERALPEITDFLTT